MSPCVRLSPIVLILLAGASSTAVAQPPTPIKATLVAQGFSRPIAFVQDPSNASRQIVAEQGGRIRLLINGAVQAADFLNLSGVVTPTSPGSGEQGLLGFAFAPDYGASGRVFASFTDVSGRSVIARFTRSIAAPLTIDPGSRFDLVWPGGLPYIVQPFANHNGGQIVFGPDGYLYIGHGDGGAGDDPGHRAQDPATLLGKMLRIDVNVAPEHATGYVVPPTNPYVGPDGVLDEIWAFGLRNPWRWTFDNTLLGGTGAMVIGDVGQITWEEIDWQPAGVGGINYGWRNREGAHPHIAMPAAFPGPLRDPIYEYPRSEGRTVVGGYVYRGSALGPAFNGRYLFADFAEAKLWSAGLSITGGEASVVDVINHSSTLGTAQAWSSFGEDAFGEIYVLAYGGALYRLDPVTPTNTNLVQNGQFTLGDPPSHWLTFATPDASYINSNLAGGVFRFYRRQPPAGTTNQALVFQELALPFPEDAPIVAAFSLGNTDSVKKRISVLIHDSDFSDLFVCTFWLPAGAPLATYSMKTHSTKGWTNATIGFYAASANAPGNTTGYYLLDDVSLQYVPGLTVTETECGDPTTPAPPGGADGPELLTNGGFGSGLAGWTTFGQIGSQIAGGVFEFIKLPGAPAGALLQATGLAMTTGQRLTAAFSLGNTSGVRKRVTVIVHDLDFSDLAACTFWIEPGQALASYSMRLFTTEAWTNATIAFYPATLGNEPWIRLDNVSLRRTPSAPLVGTECLEPGSSTDVGWSSAARGSPTGGRGLLPPASQPEPAALDGQAPASGRQTVDALYRWIGDGFDRSGDPAPGQSLPSWTAANRPGESPTLTRGARLAVPADRVSSFAFQSWLSSSAGRAVVEVSINGTDWETLEVVPPSDGWMPVRVDLMIYRGAAVSLRFRLVGPDDGSEPPGTWRLAIDGLR